MYIFRIFGYFVYRGMENWLIFFIENWRLKSRILYVYENMGHFYGHNSIKIFEMTLDVSKILNYGVVHKKD